MNQKMSIKPLKIVQIEVTNLCNANCVFCPHSKVKKFGTMTDHLFKKILNDVKKINSVERIIPMLLGEPFCDRKFLQKLKLINKILPGMKITIFTNCSLLSRKKIIALSKIKNLEVFFSLNGACKKTRQDLMRLFDYDNAIKMIDLYAKTGRPYVVTLVKHPIVSSAEILEFKKKYGNHMVVEYKNFSGDIFDDGPKTHCNRAISEMTIMWDGIVNLCCMDAYGKVTFGDVNIASVKDIWESEARQKYANVHLDGHYMRGVPCSNCTKA